MKKNESLLFVYSKINRLAVGTAIALSEAERLSGVKLEVSAEKEKAHENVIRTGHM